MAKKKRMLGSFSFYAMHAGCKRSREGVVKARQGRLRGMIKCKSASMGACDCTLDFYE